MTKKQTKEFHYKHAEVSGNGGVLQAAVEKAIKHCPLALDRLEKMGLGGEQGRVLLHPRHHEGLLCATLAAYTPGANQPIVGVIPALEN